MQITLDAFRGLFEQIIQNTVVYRVCDDALEPFFVRIALEFVEGDGFGQRLWSGYKYAFRSQMTPLREVPVSSATDFRLLRQLYCDLMRILSDAFLVSIFHIQQSCDTFFRRQGIHYELRIVAFSFFLLGLGLFSLLAVPQRLL